MALKFSDLILRDVWSIAGFDIQTGKPLFNLTNCNNTTFTAESTKVEITGGRGAPVLAVFSSDTRVSLNVESATFDLNLLALQAGDAGSVYESNVVVPFKEEIVIPSGATPEVTLKHTPAADGDAVSIILKDGTPLIEGTVATTTTFTISDNKLTFSPEHAGKSGVVFYDIIVNEAVDITFDAKSQIKYCTIKAEVTAVNQCDGLQYLGYIIIPRAGVDKNFTIEASKNGEGAVHNIVFDAIQTCGNSELARFVIYDPKVE